MRASIYILGAAFALASAQELPEVSAAPGSLPVGAVCSSKEQCANGADCYGVTSFTVKTCGSFQSACTSDSQCATNTCNEGFCNGALTTSATVPETTATGIYIPSQSSVIAEPSSLPLGARCSSKEQCANGADCYGVSAWTVTTCGSFQSACERDDQCATNSCNQGFCNGEKVTTGTVTAPDTTSTTGVYIPSQSSVIAEPSSLPVGSRCSSSEQCANGAQCYGVSAMTITTCGSFQATCERDDQCATNTCNQGACNGLLPSGSTMSTVTQPTGAPTGSNGTVTVPTSPVQTGAAAKIGAGFGAAFFALVALAL